MASEQLEQLTSGSITYVHIGKHWKPTTKAAKYLVIHDKFYRRILRKKHLAGRIDQALAKLRGERMRPVFEGPLHLEADE